jgi:hypothetical protein
MTPPATEGSRTLEVRWIRRGRIPAAALERLGPFADQVEEREDRYLIEPSVPHLGVKIKAGVQLDLKAFRGSPGELTLPGWGSGRLEVWEKWTYPLEADALPPSDAAGWLTLGKVRHRRSFRLVDGGVVERPVSEAERPGCSLELTEVAVGDATWWTVGLEACGDPGTREGSLRAAVDALFLAPAPDGLRFDPRDSMSYAGWLGTGGSWGYRPDP